MGVDLKGVHRVINYGPPNKIDSYKQAFGRAGSDGTNSEALLLFHGQQLQLCEPQMLDFVKCRREKFLDFFMTLVKTVESNQSTYVVALSPLTVSVDRQNVKTTQEA